MKKLFFSVLFLILLACESDYVSPLPSYPVYLKLDLAGVFATFVGSRGEQIYTSGGQIHYYSLNFPLKETDHTGFGGLLICSTFEGLYCAFDRACPYEATSDICIEIDGLKAVCPKCKSEFDIYTSDLGVCTAGAAASVRNKNRLVKYRCETHDRMLVVYN